jgi:sulfur carrier protein ThiS
MKKAPRIIAVNVRGFNLGKYQRRLPEDGEIFVPVGTTVKDFLDGFEFPNELRKLLLSFVNGRFKQQDQPLEAGDNLTIFTPLEGG